MPRRTGFARGVLRFDWHSSGVTTVTGALKEGLRDVERDLGLFALGGKAPLRGKHRTKFWIDVNGWP